MRNNVQVRLSARDELSGALRNTRRQLSSLVSVARIGLGVGLVAAVARSAKQIRLMAGDFDGQLNAAFERGERLLRDFNEQLVQIVFQSGELESAMDGLQRVLEAVLAVVMTLRENSEVLVRIFKVLASVAGVALVAALWKVVVAGGGVLAILKGIAGRFGIGRLIGGSGAIAALTFGLRGLGDNLDRTRGLLDDMGESARDATDPLTVLAREVNTLSQLGDLQQLGRSGFARIEELTDEILPNLKQRLEDSTDFSERLTLSQLIKDIKELQEFRKHTVGHIMDDDFPFLEQLLGMDMLPDELADEWVGKLEHQLKVHEANFAEAIAAGLLPEAVAEAEFIERLREFLEGLKEEIEEEIDNSGLYEGIAQQTIGSLGTALAEGFSAAFDEGSAGLVAGIKTMTGLALNAFGDMFTTIGQNVLAGGRLMDALTSAIKSLSGAGMIAAGLGMLALGGILRGVGRRIASQGQALSQQAASDILTQDMQGQSTLVIQGGILDMSDPRQRSAFSEALGQMSGRRVVVKGA